MKYLTIKNFKCFSEIEVPLKKLSVLAGINGNGKSSVIQSLLFLRRTIEHCSQRDKGKYSFIEPGDLKVELNGSYCLALGTSSGILPQTSDGNSISLGLKHSDKEFKVTYDVDVDVDKLWLKPKSVSGGDSMQDDAVFLQEFYYLNAERIGPRLNQAIQFQDYPNTGHKGEYVAQLIGDTNSNYSFKIDEKRRRPNSNSPRLEQQVNAWLDYLMSGVSVTATYHAEKGFAQIKVENKFTKGNPIVATNVGFGISYVLPIIVTGLIARKGSYMIVENPEAHLHPSAQSKIAQFLSVIAESGVNVIIETHSDHVINGIQISSAANVISHTNVAINFFDQLKDENHPSVETISINKLGELSSWPRGFFDQNQIDFGELLNYRKS